MKKDIVWLDEVNKNDHLLVGSKALALGLLSQVTDLQIPPAFVITTRVHKLGKPQQAQVMAAFSRLGSQFVAVRSSSPDEDNQNESLAGQFKTYLYVGHEKLITAIKKCWKASSGLSNQSGMAVMVQAMVPSKISGVIFTANPLSGENEVVVEAIYGLGELLTQGRATPENLRIDRRTNLILDRRLHRQRSQLVHKQGKLAEVTQTRQKQPILSNHQVSDLVKIAKRVEDYYARPQDIEWAIAKNQIYILQSRPITILSKAAKTAIEWQQGWLRGGSLLEESINLVAQSGGLQREIGAGYDTVVIVKDKGGFIPINENRKVQAARRKLKPALDYIPKSLKIEEQLKRVVNKPKTVFEEAFELIIKHLTYYGLAKHEAEILYGNPKASEAGKRFIEKWRKQNHFDSYDKLWKIISAKTKMRVAAIEFLTIVELKQLLRGAGRNWRSLAEVRKRSRWSLVYRQGRTRVYLRDMSPTLETVETPGMIKGEVAYGTNKNIRGVVGKDILVTVMTSPEMIKHLKGIKVVITDVGGQLSHAAILCRELKIPCIVGTSNATKLLQKGGSVEVDTNTGVVRQI